jgi:ABC-type uncharacterized transport system ATPase subunit
MFAVEARNITKSYGSFLANDQVHLQVRDKTIHALLGENGAGKTTLVKTLFSLIKADSGEISYFGKPVRWTSARDAIAAGVGMVQQHFRIVDRLSVVENIVLGVEPSDGFGRIDIPNAIKEIEKTLPSDSLRLPWEAETSTLSIGQKQKLEIIKLLYRKSKILFLDEPTAVLTPQEVSEFFKILEALRAEGRTIVIITHKLDEVFSICDDFTVLRAGKCVGAGKVKETSPAELIRLIVGRDIQSLPERAPVADPKVILKAKDLTEKRAGRGALKSASFQLVAGEILGIAGVEGSGQRELVEVLCGLRPAIGELEILNKSVPVASRHLRDSRVGLIPPDRHADGLWMEASCLNNVMVGLLKECSSFGVVDWKKARQQATKWIKRFRVEGPGLDGKITALSGGNQQKLLFAREVAGRDPQLLICSHPTRGVDLGAVDLIHRELLQLRAQGIGVLLISGDLDELFALSDRMQVFYEGQLVGNWSRQQFDRNSIGAAMTGART